MDLSPQKQIRRVTFSDQVERIDGAAVNTVVKEETTEHENEDIRNAPKEATRICETLSPTSWYTRKERRSFFNDIRMTLLRNPSVPAPREEEEGDCFTALDIYMDAHRKTRRITAQRAILASHRHLDSLEPLLLRLVANNNETILMPTTMTTTTNGVPPEDSSSFLLGRVANQISRSACDAAQQRGMEAYCEAYPERVMKESPTLWNEFRGQVEQREQRQAHLLQLLRCASQKPLEVVPDEASSETAIASRGLPPASAVRPQSTTNRTNYSTKMAMPCLIRCDSVPGGAAPVSPSTSRILKPRKRASFHLGDGDCFQSLTRDGDETPMSHRHFQSEILHRDSNHPFEDL